MKTIHFRFGKKKSQGFDRNMDCRSRLWLIEPKRPICWVSHTFSIWKHRYSYGICFGSVLCTPKFYPKYSKLCFLSTPKGLKSAYSMKAIMINIHISIYGYYIYYVYIYIILYIYKLILSIYIYKNWYYLYIYIDIIYWCCIYIYICIDTIYIYQCYI